MRTAGHDIPLWCAEQPLCRRKTAHTRDEVVEFGVLRRATLHSLLSLCARMRRRYGREGAWRGTARRAVGDHSESSGSSGLRGMRHVHRYLPRWCADKRHVSLSDASLGDAVRAYRLHALLEWLQDDA